MAAHLDPLAAVKPYDELTERGQLRRLRLLARGAIRHYAVVPDDARLTFVAKSFNAIFRVPLGDAAATAALRVGARLRIHADGTEAIEARWMRALRDDLGLPVPEVIEADDGAAMVRQGHAGVPEERLCVLFGWVHGRTLDEVMTPDRAQQMGRLAARLHVHAATSGRPEGVLVADRVIYWRTENRLHEVPPPHGRLFEEALGRAQQTIDTIWAEHRRPAHLLHGDLTADNIMLRDGELVPIDFQDLVWGHDIQDLAISLVAFGRFDGSDELRRRFRRGYERVRPWPEDLDQATLAALIAARRLHQLNLGLNLRRPGLDALVARVAAMTREWMT